jgi:hypothetical protein
VGLVDINSICASKQHQDNDRAPEPSTYDEPRRSQGRDDSSRRLVQTHGMAHLPWGSCPALSRLRKATHATLPRTPVSHVCVCFPLSWVKLGNARLQVNQRCLAGSSCDCACVWECLFPRSSASSKISKTLSLPRVTGLNLYSRFLASHLDTYGASIQSLKHPILRLLTVMPEIQTPPFPNSKHQPSIPSPFTHPP